MTKKSGKQHRRKYGKHVFHRAPDVVSQGPLSTAFAGPLRQAFAEAKREEKTMHEKQKTILAFDLETQKLASEVETEFADQLAGESPWSRPDLFGYGCGAAVDVETGEATRYGPDQAKEMIEALSVADQVVSYNGANFDLRVLSAYGDVSSIRTKHVDLNILVMSALDELPIAHEGTDRIRQGGLDGLARANGVAGKTGDGMAVPAMLREGKAEEVLTYCEADTRIVADLYRKARDTGVLRVEPFLRRADRERVALPAVEVAVDVAQPIPVKGEKA